MDRRDNINTVTSIIQVCQEISSVGSNEVHIQRKRQESTYFEKEVRRCLFRIYFLLSYFQLIALTVLKKIILKIISHVIKKIILVFPKAVLQWWIFLAHVSQHDKKHMSKRCVHSKCKEKPQFRIFSKLC